MLCFVCLTKVRGLLRKKALRSFAWMMQFTTTLVAPTSEGSAFTSNDGETSLMVDSSPLDDEIEIISSLIFT
jgi:hypothetical protein